MALFKDAFVPLQSLRVLNLDFTRYEKFLSRLYFQRNDQITEKGLSLLGQTISQLFQLTQLELNFSWSEQ